MPSHRTPAVLSLPTLLMLCTGTAIGQAPIEFADSGQALGNGWSTSIAAGDLDGDGDDDAIVTNCCGQPNTVWINDGNGTFTDSGQTLGDTGLMVALGDCDGDDDLDAVIVISGQPNSVWINDGNGTFTDSQQDIGRSNSSFLVMADLDGDEDLDAIFTNRNTGGEVVTVAHNDGNGNFTNSSEYLLGTVWTYSLAFGDLNGDGHLDAVLAENFGQPNRIMFNNGDGTFTGSDQALGNSTSLTVSLGDLNGDGHLDAFFTNFSFNNEGAPDTVWFNDGNGNFTDSGQALGESRSCQSALADFDDDGDLDAIVCNQEEPNTIWTNDGNGIFTESGQVLGSIYSFTVGLGDFDGDDDVDVMLANALDDPANTVWFNVTGENGGTCPGDLTKDDRVDGADLTVLLAGWNTPAADINGDGNTDGADLTILLGTWGFCR